LEHNLVVVLDSDTEGEIEIMPTCLINTQPDSSKASANPTDNEVEGRRKPNKRPRLTKEDTASLSVIDRPNSPEGSGKAFDDEPKGRRKSNAPTRFITHEFRGHIDIDTTWLNAATVRCKLSTKSYSSAVACKTASPLCTARNSSI
jgi:hypothetical protein